MMTDQQYNEFFKNRLDDFPSRVPKYIWENIKSKSHKSTNSQLWFAKYVLLTFSLFLFIKIPDSSSVANVRKPINIVFETYSKQKGEPSSFIWKEAIKKEKMIHQSFTVQNRENDHYSNLKTRDLKNPLIPDARSAEQETKWNISSEKRNESSDLSTLFSKETADSTAGDKLEANKRKPLRKQTDSTTDDMIETHTVFDHVSLYVFASPDAVFSHVSADDRNYQKQRNREEKGRFSWSAGVRLRYNVSSHWSGTIGAQWAVTNEKIRITNKTWYNRYTSFDVPLIAGYRICKKQFEVDANTGIIINASSNYKGYILSIINQPLNIRNENVYQSNTALSYYGSVQFLYRPSNTISLFAEPYFKYQPQSITTSFQPFEERMQRAGLLFGARYRFDK